MLDSQAKLEVARLGAQALLAEGEAEQAAAENLAEKRRYELEWGRLEVLTKIASQGRKFITGARADQLMDDLCPVQKEISRN